MYFATEEFLQQIRKCYARMDAAVFGEGVEYDGSNAEDENSEDE